MILYDLTCPEEHCFESWFRNSGAVEKLIKVGQVACPVCGNTKVQKAPMAPRIAKSLSQDDVPEAKKRELVAVMEKATEAFNQLRQVIEKNFDHVGTRFPEEARRIHYGESRKRGIYGDASEQETRALLDEGIEVRAIPWARGSKSN
ncbi:MAG: DUF1178 family protein [Rhodospirillaceae bacterium]|nr:DUF1178 family protein [Rhodospirillaceae bacterium]